jgi:hypothetical protein
MLECVQYLTKTSSSRKRVLNFLNFTIDSRLLFYSVMGPAGVGKSSVRTVVLLQLLSKSIGQFINIATRQTHANLGHDLESCTQDVRAVSCPHRDGSGRHVVLVEIPGFGDTSLSDCDILERTADWLMTT